jgi:hypothetical protein
VAGSRRYPHSRASSRKSISLSSLGNSATTKLRAEVKAFDGKGNPPNRRGFCGSAPIIFATNHHSQCDLRLPDVTLARRMQTFGNNVGVDCYPDSQGRTLFVHLAQKCAHKMGFRADLPCRLSNRLRHYSPNARRTNAIACGPSTGRLELETSRLISLS